MDRRRVRNAVVGVLLGTGCGPVVDDDSVDQLAVQRLDTGDVERIWITNAATGSSRELPSGLESATKLRQTCAGWDARGIYVVEDNRVLWTYTNDRPEVLASLSYDNSVVPAGAGRLVLRDRVDAASMPGENPPPGAATLSLLDSTDGSVAELGDAGDFMEISFGGGATVLTLATDYRYVPPEDPSDPSDYGSYLSESGWRVYDMDGERLPRLELEGTPHLSFSGRWLGWEGNGEVRVTSLEGTPRTAHDGQSFAWGPGDVYATFSDDHYTIREDSGAVVRMLEAPDARRLVWSATPDRVLVEFRCDPELLIYQHVVFDGSTEVYRTDCDHHEFVRWSPGNESFAVRQTIAPGDERPPSSFRVFRLEGTATPWRDGVVCDFRPPPIEG